MASHEDQIMQLYTHVEASGTILQESVEDAKRKRNRLAQRRHRQRVKSTGDVRAESSGQSAESTDGTPPTNRAQQQLVRGEDLSSLTSTAKNATLGAQDTYSNEGLAPVQISPIIARPIDSLNFGLDGSTDQTTLLSTHGRCQPILLTDTVQNVMMMTQSTVDSLHDDHLPEYPAEIDDFLDGLNATASVTPADHLDYHVLPGENQAVTNTQIGILNFPNANFTTAKGLPPAQPDCHVTEKTNGEVHSPASRISDADKDNIESRFERIIKFVENAGFESIDEMSAQYYTLEFQEDGLSYEAQSRSRRRSLHTFLQVLHSSAGQWTSREVQGYQHQVIVAAENLYINEFLNVQRSETTNSVIQRNKSAPSACSKPPDVGGLRSRLWQTMEELNLSTLFQQRKRHYRQEMPEIWSLLHQLGRKAGLPSHQASHVVSSFLLLLLEFDQGTVKL